MATVAPKKAPAALPDSGPSASTGKARKTINVKVEVDIWRKLRTEAARRDTTIQALVQELIERETATFHH